MWLYHGVFLVCGGTDSHLSTPWPPSIIGESWLRSRQLHRSRQYWYIWMAVFSSTSASSAASFTGYSRAHQYMRTIHCRSCRRDCSKNVPERSDTLFLHVETGHLHLWPSVDDPPLLHVHRLVAGRAEFAATEQSFALQPAELICLSTSGPITADRASTLSIVQQKQLETCGRCSLCFCATRLPIG